MASQFSKSESSSSSISISKYGYDVFLSFCREDVGKSFADHLYAALVKKGLHPFREPASASESLMAIQKSKAFVVIFSRNYADHLTDLLPELAEIIRCGKPVVPVFYNVDPSEVREQSGNYGKAFAKYEAEHDKEGADCWRTALTEATNLRGYPLDHGGYEQTIIMEITDIIVKLLRRQYFDGDGLVGINKSLQELMSLIGIGFDEVRMVGVYGIGGIGKTTIVEALYNSISCEFDGVSFLPNVREKSILQLQKQLLLDMTGVEDKNLNLHKWIKVMSRKLRQKKVLIVVDNVDCLSQLEDLVPDRVWFGEGSRIIITTRDKHLLLVHGVDAIYEVSLLNSEESRTLFSHCAFGQSFPKQGFEELSLNMVRHAKGLPLALQVLGSMLYGRTKSEWENEFENLKQLPMKNLFDLLKISFDRQDHETKKIDKLKQLSMKDLFDRLKISFDRLDHETKNIFLDIACFFEGEERELIFRILDGAVPEIQVLYDMSLLKFSNNKIMMHPLVGQMGREVVRQECPGEPGKQSRLWSSQDIHYILSKNEGTKVIEGIFLNQSASEPIEFKFTTKAFKMMYRLRILKVFQKPQCGSAVKNYEVHVSPNFEFPSYELRYLHWDGYPLESLPSNFDGKKLVELNLQYSKLGVLWKGSKILEKLKVINLSHSQQLLQIPDLSDIPNLESLILEGCTNLKKLPSTIWELDSLAHLDLSHCSELQKLPEIEWNLYALEYLNLAFCKKLESLPGGLCNLQCLKTLNLTGCSKLDKLPESLGSLECLEKLCASDAILISPQSHSSLTGLCSLKILDVHGTCLMQGSISSDIGSLYLLEELDLSYCNLVEGGIPEDICCLYSLRVLDLSGNHFLSVTEAISQLSKLRVLGLRHCKSLLELPKLPSGLRVLDAHDCTGMKILSNTSTSPWQSQLNCFKSSVLQERQELKCGRVLSLPANGVSQQGFSTVIPGNGEVPEWISFQSLGNEITALLPPYWYQDRGFLGFALCCVYAQQQDEPAESNISKDESEPIDEPAESSLSKDESDEESENATQPYRLGCELTFLENTIEPLDKVYSGSSCQCDDHEGVSDSVWVTYYSTISIKEKYLCDEARRLKASFSGYVIGKPVKVVKCGIGIVHI